MAWNQTIQVKVSEEDKSNLIKEANHYGGGGFNYHKWNNQI